MNRTWKTLCSLVLALTMALSLGVPAWAEDGGDAPSLGHSNEGQVAARFAVAASQVDVVIYWDPTNGDDSKYGLLESTAVKTFAVAAERVVDAIKAGAACDTILLMDAVPVSADETLKLPDGLDAVTVQLDSASNRYPMAAFVVTDDATLGIEDGITVDAGGEDGIVLDQNTQAILANAHLKNCKMGIRASSQSKITLNGNATISECTQPGVYLYEAELEMNGDSSLFNNRSGIGGGGVYVGQGSLTMNDNASIHDNSTSTQGGGVLLVNAALVMKSNASICDNTATSSGGGVYVSQSSLTMNGNASISGNTSSNGGGVAVVANGALSVNGSASIHGNMAESMGGGVFMSRGVMEMSANGSVRDNTAQYLDDDVSQNNETVKIKDGVTIGLYESRDGGFLTVTGEIDGGGITVWTDNIKKPFAKGDGYAITDTDMQYFTSNQDYVPKRNADENALYMVEREDEPAKKTYTLTVIAGTGGFIIAGESGEYEAGKSVPVLASPNSGYSFSGWTTSNGGDFADENSPSTTFFMPAANTTITAGFTNTGNGDPDTGGNSKDREDRRSDSSSTPPTVSAPASRWLEPSPAQTLSNRADSSRKEYTRTSSTSAYGVRGSSWAKLGGMPYRHDTMDGAAVAVRLIIGEPENLDRDAYVTGHVTGDIVEKRKAFFEKWYTNQIQVIHMDESEPWGQTVEIAAKVDLTGMDTDHLYIYSYDRETNTYTRVSAEKYWIDNKGYLHFYTELAGDIIVSEGPLERR